MESGTTDEVLAFLDLNPLAVLAARANLLIELGELVDYTPEVELPVYLCDSIRPPTAGNRLTGSFYEVNEVPENGSSGTEIEIKVPGEIVNRGLVNQYFETAEECSSDGVDSDTFITVFDNEYGINKGFTRNALQESYSDMMDLRDRDVDGIWWEIVKNRFRPRFCGKFDYVIGNPPYITVDRLPQSYRDDIVEEWGRYGIAPTGRGGARKMEHALLFAARALDKYVKKQEDADEEEADDSDGILTYILPSSVQRGGKADAFREHISNTTRLQSITDTADLNPFDITKNRTVILTTKNSGETEFPVPCETWIGDRPDFTASLEQVRRDTEQYDFHAMPLGDLLWKQVIVSQSDGLLVRVEFEQFPTLPVQQLIPSFDVLDEDRSLDRIQHCLQLPIRLSAFPFAFLAGGDITDDCEDTVLAVDRGPSKVDFHRHVFTVFRLVEPLEGLWPVSCCLLDVLFRSVDGVR
jgi:hypothetical protein